MGYGTVMEESTEEIGRRGGDVVNSGINKRDNQIWICDETGMSNNGMWTEHGDRMSSTQNTDKNSNTHEPTTLPPTSWDHTTAHSSSVCTTSKHINLPP